MPAKCRNEFAQEAYPRFDLEESNYGLAATDFSGRPTDRNPGEKRLDSLAVRLIVADAL